MDPNEITEELEHPGSRSRLESATILRLAHDGSDGFPRVIPIGFNWNGNEIVVRTAATAPKVTALSARPNVAITIDVGDTPTEAKALLVRGLATAEIVNGVPDEYIAASKKALDADQGPEFERKVASMYDQMARIAIEPLWARFFDVGAGRMSRFLQRLASDAQSAHEPPDAA
jgi:Pyridoxamine 5'-phosphate oxidase